MKKALTMALVATLAGGSVMAQAYEKGDFIFRVGATTVAPDSDSTGIDLRAYAPDLPVLHADVDDDTQVGLIPVYMMTEQVAIELLAASPFEHDISLKGKGGVNVDAGSTKHLPPTLSVQWYPRGGKSGWQPYVGLGVNYTIFFDEDTTKELDETLNAILGATKVDLNLDNSFGLALQAGVDFPLSDHWAINAGVWYMDIDTNAKVKTDVGNVDFKVDIDPWVYNVGIAYKF
jgi:outer membrane protein